MKLHYPFSLLFSLFCFSLIAQTSYEGTDANEIVPGAISVLMESRSPVPTFVVMDEDHLIPVQAFEQWEKETFQYNNEVSFVITKTVKDEDGLTHQFREQIYRGIPIDYALSVIHSEAGMVTYFNGDIHSDLSISVTPKTELADATEKALQLFNISLDDWNKIHPSHDDQSFDHGDHSHQPLTQTLVVYPFEGEFFLAWKLQIMSSHFNTYKFVYIDAQTGKVINSFSGMFHCNEGDANTTWRGNQTIWTDDNEVNFEMRNDCGNRFIETGILFVSGPSVFNNAGNSWTSANDFEEAGRTSHFGITQAFDYFEEDLGQIGFDGSSGDIDVYMLPAPFGNNAGYAAGTNDLFFGMGTNNSIETDDFTTLDICGHEFAHGVFFNTGGVTNLENHETLALHEGIADIFGNEVETYFDGGTPDWSTGEERDGPNVRYIDDPNADIHPVGPNGSPDTYLGDFWSGSSQHVDGGVIRFWYYLLSQGGSGQNDNNTEYSVQGIGRTAAANILFRAISSGSFGSTPNYLTARGATLQAAGYIYGECSNQRRQVMNAWKAVGIGISLPADISLSNLSIAGSGNTVPTIGNFTVNYDLAASDNTDDYPNAYVGFFLRPYCSDDDLTSPFDVEVELISTGVQTTLSLPTGTEPGIYSLFAKADPFDWLCESNEKNNTECIVIKVTDKNLVAPDFIPGFAAVSPSTVEAGNDVTAFVALSNIGNAVSGSSIMCYSLSTDPFYSSNDINLGTLYFGSLNPSSSTSGSKVLTIPASTSPGTYYIVYRADCYNWRDELNENNNNTFRSITVTAPPSNLPDLVITGVDPSPSTGSPPNVTVGQYLTVNYSLTNQQNGNPAGSSTTRIYLSLDNSYGSGDFLVDVAYAQLPGPKNANIQIPSEVMANQYYYILIIADFNNNVVEAYEDNNVGFGHVYVVTGLNNGNNEPVPDNLYTEKYEDDSTTATERNESIQQDVEPLDEIKVYPNPTRREFTLEYPVQEDETVSISILNVAGQQLNFYSVEASEQTGQWQYSGEQLPSGLYFVYWQSGEQRKVVKIIVE